MLLLDVLKLKHSLKLAGDLEQLGKRTKAGAIDGACEFTEEMIPNLKRAIEHPDMTPELAEILSTNKVQLDYRIATAVEDLYGGLWITVFSNRS